MHPSCILLIIHPRIDRARWDTSRARISFLHAAAGQRLPGIWVRTSMRSATRLLLVSTSISFLSARQVPAIFWSMLCGLLRLHPFFTHPSCRAAHATTPSFPPLTPPRSLPFSSFSHSQHSSHLSFSLILSISCSGFLWERFGYRLLSPHHYAFLSIFTRF